MQNSDDTHMQSALKLAVKGRGMTDPNPMVGAVIVRHGRVIGKGYHTRFGSAHAEVEAMKKLSDVKNATLYVSLEPCSHFGKTPPCTDAIIRSGIKRVVIACLDPNPQVHGSGVRALEKAGLDVTIGVLEDAAKELNEAFCTYHTLARPFIAVKFASSLDGKLATRTRDAKWITNDEARDYARTLRAQYQAILVGVNTVLHDDPHLGSRIPGVRDPVRIVLDSRLRTPLKSKILRDNNVILFTLKNQAPTDKVMEIQQRGAQVILLQGNHISISNVLKRLHTLQIISVLIEGGGDVIGSFIDDGSVDKVYAFYAPILIGGSDATQISGNGVNKVNHALRLSTVSAKRFGDNFLLTGRIAKR